ncbi:MAG: hypothetical protein RBU45_21555, partial [Myxococcota bacterium]|nr:hypothetical protein [Myxococcota bacterium]
RKDGILSAIQVKKGGVDVHRVADATPDDAPRVSSLKLVDPEGEALPTSPAPPTWFPAPSRHPASHGADGAAGVTLQHRLGPDNALGLQPGPGLLQNRTWQAVWEGEIPGAASTWGRFDPELPGVLHDQKRDFCLAGVVPGDRLILLSRVEKSATLGRDCALLFDEQALQGREGFEYCIREVSPHTLWLQAVPADGTPALPGQPCPEVDLRRRPVRLAELRGDPALAAADEQPELVLLAPKRPLDPLPWGPAVPAEGLGGGGVADTSCFPELVSYTIRSSGNFLVWTLLDSGAAYFPHAQTSALTNDQPDEREGHCELVRSPSPLQQSRAWPGIPFKNEAFSFTMQPAPEPWAVAARYPERAWAGAIDPRVHRPPRGTSWQITVQGALNPQRYSLGSLLGGVAVDPVRGRVYVGDSGLERVLEVTLTTGSVTLVSQ